LLPCFQNLKILKYFLVKFRFEQKVEMFSIKFRENKVKNSKSKKRKKLSEHNL